jgi:hypothetical protein
MIAPDDVDDPDVASQLLNLFCNAWVSGYASAFTNSAANHGHTKAEVVAFGQSAELGGQQRMARMVEDPASRHLALETIRHVLAGCPPDNQPFHGIATIHHRDSPIKDGS